MKVDVILAKFFEKDRWEYAIEKGILKDIDKGTLRRLTTPEMRCCVYEAMKAEKYCISPPHTAKIPKDNGDYRTVYVNEPMDRVILSIANDLLFELMPEMIHPACVSYQKGIGCGKVVKQVSHAICDTKGSVIGWKADLSKYFDSVPIRFIDTIFDKVEAKYGTSPLITVLRKYYHSDWYFDKNGELLSAYQSLKQGCAVASWLANVLLYELDKELSEMDGYYVRYSDDMLFVGSDYKRAMERLEQRLSAMEMRLNPKKVEYLTHTRWFKFLGFSIKGENISLSSSRIKRFQHEIAARTTHKRGITLTRAIRNVYRFLYHGDGEHSWATQILPTCNVSEDILELDKYVMDSLRAVVTHKAKIGGLGYVAAKNIGCIQRGLGRNVRANRQKIPQIDGYMTIGCAHKAILASREAYNTLIRTL